MEPKYITSDPKLTAAQKAAFEAEYALTSDAQKTYGQIIAGIMKKKGINEEKAAELTGLNKKLFCNLTRDCLKNKYCTSHA